MTTDVHTTSPPCETTQLKILGKKSQRSVNSATKVWSIKT